MLRTLVSGTALLVLWAPAASTQPGTGNDLQRTCLAVDSNEVQSAPSRHNPCSAWLASIVNAATSHSMGIAGSCVPFGVTPEQLRQVWLDYASKYPEELSGNSDSVALTAFNEAWPCDKR